MDTIHVGTGPTNSTAVSLLSLDLFTALHLLRVSLLYNREYLGSSQFTYLLRNPRTGIFRVTVVRGDERCDCSPPLCSQFWVGQLVEFGWPVCPMAGCLFLFLLDFLLWVAALTAYLRVLYIVHALRLLVFCASCLSVR